MDFLFQPWEWYVAGPVISIVMFLLYYFGEHFGVSSNLETLCSIGGAGKVVNYFKIDWKENLWNLIFIAGAIIGGFVASQYLTTTDAVNINFQRGYHAVFKRFFHFINCRYIGWFWRALGWRLHLWSRHCWFKQFRTSFINFSNRFFYWRFGDDLVNFTLNILKP